jgi:hypothetical protein
MQIGRVKKERGEILTVVARVPTNSGEGVLETNAGGVLATFGRRRGYDDDQLVERNSMVMTTGSIASRGRR